MMRVLAGGGGESLSSSGALDRPWHLFGLFQRPWENHHVSMSVYESRKEVPGASKFRKTYCFFFFIFCLLCPPLSRVLGPS